MFSGLNSAFRLRELERKNRDLTDEVRSLKSINDELNRKQRDLVSDNDNLNRSVQDLERENRKLQIEIDHLTMQLKKLGGSGGTTNVRDETTVSRCSHPTRISLGYKGAQ